jgi:DNA-binding LacI/PurR family transcriptional regulator
MAVTRKDVARYANVSPATVSNVINNKDIVKPSLRKKVLEAINKLGYQPNMIARSLKTRETKQIALVSNDITNQYYAEVVLGMEDEAKKAGYIVCMIDASNNERYFANLLSFQFDGIIIYTDKVTINQVNSLCYRNISTIFIGNEGYVGLDSRVTQIHLDIYGGAYKELEYLIECGHKRIGFISSRILKDIYEPDYRLEAYIDVLKKHNIELDMSIVDITGETMESAYKAANKMLSLENRPTAFFTGNDNMALPIMSAIKSKNLKIPDDISVVGFENISVSKYFDPPLTTVEMPKYELGKITLNLLLKKIKKEKVEDVKMELDLVKRKSVKKIK